VQRRSRTSRERGVRKVEAGNGEKGGGERRGKRGSVSKGKVK